MAWMIAAGTGTLVAATLVARLVGRALRTRPGWWYWAASAFILLVAVGLVLISTVLASDVLWGVGLGLGFGGLAGLRYGLKGLFEVRPVSKS
jgi:hypothetical protein